MFNPWMIVGAVILAASLLGSGIKIGIEWEQGREAQLDIAIEKVSKAAALSAAEEINKIEIVQRNITKQVETITREVPVYRDCVHDPNVERLLDTAREGSGLVANSSELPTVGESHPQEF